MGRIRAATYPWVLIALRTMIVDKVLRVVVLRGVSLATHVLWDLKYLETFVIMDMSVSVIVVPITCARINSYVCNDAPSIPTAIQDAAVLTTVVHLLCAKATNKKGTYVTQTRSAYWAHASLSLYKPLNLFYCN